MMPVWQRYEIGPPLAKIALFQLKEDHHCEKVCSVAYSYVEPYGSVNVPNFELSSYAQKPWISPLVLSLSQTLHTGQATSY